MHRPPYIHLLYLPLSPYLLSLHRSFFRSLGCGYVALCTSFLSMERAAAMVAGETWRLYRSRGGKRRRVIADFLIAAHAQAQCDRLLTRDRGFYREYFKTVRLVDPCAECT